MVRSLSILILENLISILECELVLSSSSEHPDVDAVSSPIISPLISSYFLFLCDCDYCEDVVVSFDG
jgi:hypothetical protein